MSGKLGSAIVTMGGGRGKGFDDGHEAPRYKGICAFWSSSRGSSNGYGQTNEGCPQPSM